MPPWACDKMGFYPDQGLQLHAIMFLHKMNNHAKIFSSVVNILRFTLKFISTVNPLTDDILLTESCILDEDGDLQYNHILQLVPQYPDIVGRSRFRSDWLWLISTDLFSTEKFCHTIWLRIKLADITQDTAVCFQHS